MAGALSGTQEYMAAEALHALHGDQRGSTSWWSTRHRAATRSTSSTHPGVLTPDSSTTDVFKLADDADPERPARCSRWPPHSRCCEAVGRVVGSDVLADAVAFFQAFAGMETSGSGERAEAVDRPAAGRRDPNSCRGRLTAAHDTITEAEPGFADQLGRAGSSRVAMPAIVNRVQPPLRRRAPMCRRQVVEASTGALARRPRPVSAVWEQPRPSCSTIPPTRSGRHSTRCVARVAPARRWSQVPLLAGDVHDLDGTRSVSARHLFA